MKHNRLLFFGFLGIIYFYLPHQCIHANDQIYQRIQEALGRGPGDLEAVKHILDASNVALSTKENTIAEDDNGYAGAAWVFPRSGTSWSQEGVGELQISVNNDGCEQELQDCICSNNEQKGFCYTGDRKSGLYCHCEFNQEDDLILKNLLLSNTDNKLFAFIKQMYHLGMFAVLKNIDTMWHYWMPVISIFVPILVYAFVFRNILYGPNSFWKYFLYSASPPLGLIGLKLFSYTLKIQESLHIYNPNDWLEKQLIHWADSHFDHCDLDTMEQNLWETNKTVFTSRITYLIASLATISYLTYKYYPMLRNDIGAFFAFLINAYHLRIARQFLHERTFSSGVTNVPELGDIVMGYVGNDFYN